MASLLRSRQVLVTTAATTTAVTAAYIALRPHSTASAETAPQTFNKKIGFTSLHLHSSEDVNHNTKRLRFLLPEGEDASSGLVLTSALLSFTFPNGAWFPTVRPYTPVSALDQKGEIEFMIKRYENGKASGVFHSLKPGDSVTFFNKPVSSYKWQPNGHPEILLIAGGAGVTPCFQFLRGILSPPPKSKSKPKPKPTETTQPAPEKDTTKITLLWGVNTSADLLLKSELDALASKYPDQFRVIYTVSDGKIDSALEAEGVRKGRVTGEMMKDVLGFTPGSGDSDESEKRLKNMKVFLCGPPAMETALTGKGKGGSGDGGVLAKVGFEKGQVVQF